MGRGLIKNRNKLKRQYLNQTIKEIERLEKENLALKNDPQSAVGQFIQQYQEIYTQNSRLSVLAAALLQKIGGTSTLTKAEMEAFKGNRINIKWELPEGVEKPEEASEYVFSYELTPAPEVPAGPEATTEMVEVCTDPDCTLPKDLKHQHTAEPEPVEETASETV